MKLLRRIKNNAWYIFAGIGFIVIILSASASDAGASLQAVIPPAVAGVLTMCVGIVRGNQTAERRRKEMQVAKRRHGMKLMTMQKEADERYEKSV